MTVARHRTLSNTIQWSYDLLRPPERELFEKLSVFSGGFQLEAAEALAGADILDPLTGLVEHSLVIVQPGRPANMRYRVLEVLRQFAEARPPRLARQTGFVSATPPTTQTSSKRRSQSSWVSTRSNG